MVALRLDMRRGSLLVLIIQNTTLALLLRYTRSTVAKEAQGGLYLVSTAVFVCEFLKFLVSIFMVFKESKAEFNVFYKTIKEEIIENKFETSKLAIPAFLYMVQNNLQYIAASNLDAATFQVTYQMKIFTTAMFSVVMLGKKLDMQKWLALCLLVAGVVLVQWKYEDEDDVETKEMDTMKGLASVTCACLTSGFSGVYFEKLLKGSKTTLWVRNVQMSSWGLLAALLGVLFQDLDAVLKDGFFQFYDTWVWAVILCSTGGGLLTALVVKYADNILKAFATSIAIILTACVSSMFFGFVLTLPFFSGASIVIWGVYLYNSPQTASSDKSLPI